MAIQNTVAVFIGGINLTSFTVFPLKWGNFLDEQLDEMHVSLRSCPIESFNPLTPVEIQFTNQLLFDDTQIDNQTETKRYLVADDSGVIENPVGSGLYNHDLYIIEVTKILERIVVDTNTITNDLGKIYTQNAEQVTPTTVITTEMGNAATVFLDYFFQPTTPPSYRSPLPSETFSFFSPAEIFPLFWNQWEDYTYAGFPSSPIYDPYLRIFVQKDGSNIYEAWRGYNHVTQEWSQSGDFANAFTTPLQNGVYTVLYHCELASYSVAGTAGAVQYTLTGYKYSDVTYTFTVVDNIYPLKKWTITDVINRLLDIAEPIRQGETPRFRLQGMNTNGTYQAGSQAAKFDTVLAPQFSFTKSTLRECLQQIGGVIHGEPRADIAQDSGGTYYYEISFDLYGQTEKSGIWSKKYISKTVSQVVDSYASHLDSNAENLVNQLDKYSGVIVEPYDGGYKTVRTETMYERITDANMEIPTQCEIFDVAKLEVGFIPDNLDVSAGTIISPYLFEVSVYNSQLSSYSSEYPYSKAYGLYYTQGQKGIRGLSFKPEHPISPVFENYSIINILRQAAADQGINISVGSDNNNDYPLLAFRVTYTPFYTARVGQTKQNYLDYPIGAGLIYNQQANVIESRYYGENLKGTIARIGNIEKSITYNLARLSEIPAAGQMFDDDYYISAVSVEFLPTMIKCTIGLSKDFNRLSQYIGISSVKRFSEVSQGQAVERNTLWREYIVVGDSIAADSACRVGDNFMNAVANTFLQTSTMKPLTNVAAYGRTYEGDNNPAVYLPLISSAFGNSISFSWEYEDNYSAGAISQYASNTFTDLNGQQVTVQGYFQNNYRYTDVYGKIYYYHFDLQEAGPPVTSYALQRTIGTSLPGGSVPTSSSGYVSTVGQQPYLLRKDNREKLQCNFQIDFVTNRKGLIIGSALAAYNPCVRGSDSSLQARLYVFDEPINKFVDHVEGSLNVDLSAMQYVTVTVSSVSNGQFYVSAPDFTTAGKSWAIVTRQNEQSETVEDDRGNVITQTVQYGGDVLLAQNMDISAGDSFTPIYFTKKREVFDKTVWKTLR